MSEIEKKMQNLNSTAGEISTDADVLVAISVGAEKRKLMILVVACLAAMAYLSWIYLQLRDLDAEAVVGYGVYQVRESLPKFAHQIAGPRLVQSVLPRGGFQRFVRRAMAAAIVQTVAAHDPADLIAV